MRGTGNDLTAFKKNGMNVRMLPYFGDSEEDSWPLTYPSFNVSVNKEVSGSESRESLCMKVLDVMFSEKAQNILAGEHNMIPYNDGVTLKLDDSMKNLEKYISRNHLYLRLASNEIFDASAKTVGKMVSGEYDAAKAYDEFNRLLKSGDTEKKEPAVSFKTGYSNEFIPEKGNPAGSAMTNTLRDYFGSDILIANGVSYSGIVYGTDYTEEQLDYMITDTTIKVYEKELTGGELKKMLKAMVEKEYGNIGVSNLYMLPVLSGCEVVISRDDKGFNMEKATVKGKKIKDDDTFKVTCVDSHYHAGPMFEELWKDKGGAGAWTMSEYDCRQHWRRCVLGGGAKIFKLTEPADYIDMVS